MDTGIEYESSLCEDDDGLKAQPTPSDNDDPGYQPSDSPSSSEEDGSKYLHRPQKIKKHGESQGAPIILKRHHLGVYTDLEVGTVMSNGETLELDDGSFLKMTSFGETENSEAVQIFGHLLRRIEEFQDDLPVIFGGSELVLLREAKSTIRSQKVIQGPPLARMFSAFDSQSSPHQPLLLNTFLNLALEYPQTRICHFGSGH